jgi:hypothetical protein
VFAKFIVLLSVWLLGKPENTEHFLRIALWQGLNKKVSGASAQLYGMVLSTTNELWQGLPKPVSRGIPA